MIQDNVHDLRINRGRSSSRSMTNTTRERGLEATPPTNPAPDCTITLTRTSCPPHSSSRSLLLSFPRRRRRRRQLRLTSHCSTTDKWTRMPASPTARLRLTRNNSSATSLNVECASDWFVVVYVEGYCTLVIQTRRQWSVGLRGVFIAMCPTCWKDFRADPSRLDVDATHQKVTVGVCSSCVALNHRARFEPTAKIIAQNGNVTHV